MNNTQPDLINEIITELPIKECPHIKAKDLLAPLGFLDILEDLANIAFEEEIYYRRSADE
jgi:hypothetical protein